jgi:ligand-binding sensor domain-containing protein
VGTGDGLGLFDGKTWSVVTAEKTDLPYDAIHALAVNAQGDLWIGTGEFYGDGGGGLAKLKKQFFQWMLYTTENSEVPGDQILELAVDPQGNLWVGTVENNGVAMFDGETWTVYTSKNSDLPRGSIAAIACDAQGTIWIGADGGGVAHFDGTAWTGYTTRNSELPNNNVHALALDAQGILWVGTEQGLARFNGDTWNVYTPDNSGLPHQWIWTLTPDIQGNLWIGTMVGGVAVYREGGVLFPEKTTRVEDLVGIWEIWFYGKAAYMQFEADGTLKCAQAKDKWLQDPSSLNYSGRFWFEGGVLKITDSKAEAKGQGPGTYEVWVRKRDGNAVHLSFHVIEDPSGGRTHDLTRGMTRIEP